MNRSTVHRLASLLVAGWLLLFSAGELLADGWKTGTAVVKITPREPVWMSGYGNRTKPGEGTIHDLWAKALAVEALKIFDERNIDDLIVVNHLNEPIGLIDSQDLPKLKLM